ncbi:hypothetical protein Tco_0003228 [Tanacetum coccineum]
MQEAVDVAVQLKYDRIREESTTANQQFLDSIDEGMKKIIKEQVKKEVSKITRKIKKLVTDQLESEVLVQSSKEANTSHAVAANLSELELKKILIDKMEANNSINRSDIQRQLYKALVDAYEADKILLDTYGDTVTIKRPRDGADDDQEPSAGTDRGSKRSRSGKEPASTSAPSENETRQQEKTTMSLSHLAHQEFETGVHDEQAEEEVQHLPDWFQQPTRLPSPDHAWNKSVPAVHESVQPWLSNLANHPSRVIDELKKRTLHLDFSAFVMNRKPTKPQRIIGLDHPEGIDDVLYKFKKATSMTRIQDIKDIRVVIQRRVEDLQLGVESYQKKLNLTKPDTYRSNLRRQDAYTPYSDPRGFIYENKDKKNRLMRIDELHKFNTTAGNPVKKILLKLNLSDHRSILTDRSTPSWKKQMSVVCSMFLKITDDHFVLYAVGNLAWLQLHVRKYLCETSGRDWQHITSQLNTLGREIKKVNEKVYAAQVGCEQCKGPHYTKDCPLKEEGKTLEEAYYTQFGGPFQGGGYRAAAPGFYQRNNANPSYQE